MSLVDVLEEDEELENEACAVLGGSDSEKCSYSQVGARRGPHLPWAPAEPALPDRTWTYSRLPRSASQWWSEAAFRRRLPQPRPSCPTTPSVLAPFLSLGPTGPPPPRSSFGRSGFSRLWPWSSCFPSSPVSSRCALAAFHGTVPVTSQIQTSLSLLFPSYLLGTEWEVKGESPEFENLPVWAGLLDS